MFIVQQDINYKKGFLIKTFFENILTAFIGKPKGLWKALKPLG